MNPTASFRTCHASVMSAFLSARSFHTVTTALLLTVIIVNVLLITLYVFHDEYAPGTFAYGDDADFKHSSDGGLIIRINSLDAGAIDNNLKPSSFNSEPYYMFANAFGHKRKLMEDRGVGNGVNLLDTHFDLEELALSDDRLRAAVGRPGVRLLNCTETARIDDVIYLSRGWTKIVYSGVYDGQPVAIKTVDVNGHDVTNCLAEGHNVTSCYARSARKIVREIALLTSLTHENVIKILGFCIEPKLYDGHEITSVTMITELGEPIDQIKLFQMSWEDRLRLSLDISRLVHYLTRSSLGSIALNDFRHSQFVLVGGSLRLTDVDDAGRDEPTCGGQDFCEVKFGNISKRLRCNHGRCQGHNELLNLYKTGQEFIRLFLPYGSPKSLRSFIQNVINKTDSLSYNSEHLLASMQSIVDMYRSGSYLDKGRRNTTVNSKYALYMRSDLPGQFDYRCRSSLSGDGCTLSVFDLKEAKDICDSDEECQGFVWTQTNTWTGRTIIHLKNGFNVTTTNSQTDLFVKKLKRL